MPSYDPIHHHRRSIRLKGYDYTQAGAYFITICTHDRAHWFGEVVDGEMRLNDAGRIADQCWRDIPAHFPHVKLDACVIMPNHVHGILWIVDNDDAGSQNVVGRRMRRPYQIRRDRGALRRNPSAPLSANSNPPSPNALTNCATPPAHSFGNAITTNTSSATNAP